MNKMFCNFLDIPGGVQCSRCEHKQRRRTLRNCDLVPKAQRTTIATSPAKPRIKGPGDYLHDLIVAWVGKSAQCCGGCQDWIDRMNRWGPQVCRDHLDEIIDRLLAEAKKRGWWKYAVALPGSRFAVRWLVLAAIEQAEKAEKSATA